MSGSATPPGRVGQSERKMRLPLLVVAFVAFVASVVAGTSTTPSVEASPFPVRYRVGRATFQSPSVPSGQRHKGWQTAQSEALLVRGGDGTAVATNPFKVLAGYVAASKARCWMVLLSAVFLEIGATSLTKRASDTSNPFLMVGALCLYNSWYDQVLVPVLYCSCFA